MTLQLVMMAEGRGGQQQSAAVTTSKAASVIVTPFGSSSSHGVNLPFLPSHIAADTSTAVCCSSTGPMGTGGGDEQPLAQSWLDLTADIASFMEMTETTIPVDQEVDKAMAMSHFLTVRDDEEENIVMSGAMDLEEEDSAATELLMSANLKILENFITEVGSSSSDENSEDAFGSDLLDSNQSLIDEVESYLLAATGGEPTIVAAEDDEKMMIPDLEVVYKKEEPGTPVIQHTSSRQKTIKMKKGASAAAAEPVSNNNNSNILKALVAGKVCLAADDDSSSDLSLNLSEEDLSNAYTTTVKTENGQNVIIIIAQPAASTAALSPLSPPRALSPQSSYLLPLVGSPGYASSPSSSASSDYEWSPSPAAAGQQQQQRKKYQRKTRPTLVQEPYPRDKAERKKAQNRTAAFRYREKKKAEQDAVDSELDQLGERNAALRARLRDMEQEYRCLKRLMLETGLGHLVREAAFTD